MSQCIELKNSGMHSMTSPERAGLARRVVDREALEAAHRRRQRPVDGCAMSHGARAGAAEHCSSTLLEQPGLSEYRRQCH
jgi:hypothetical protein